MISSLLDRAQFSIPEVEKQEILLAGLNELTVRHRACCPAYARILDALGHGQASALTLEQLPYLPVSLFKTHDLRSVPDADVSTVLTSSGTTGQAVSRIALDAETAALQARALTAVLGTAIGKQRLPMLIVDSRTTIRDPRLLSARGAGIVGLMRFGRNHHFLLDDAMSVDVAGLRAFLDRLKGAPFLIFGFTFMVWQYLYKTAHDIGLDLSNGTLIHSGGWKKMTEIAVDNASFRHRFGAACGLTRIYNFYGMVEQMGSLFLEGEDGLLYAPNFVDVICRDPLTWLPVPNGKPGLIQVLSLLPRSYPGHSLLTEDVGVIGRADGVGGWHGKGLSIVGRAPRSELRGCSDTHAYSKRAE